MVGDGFQVKKAWIENTRRSPQLWPSPDHTPVLYLVYIIAYTNKQNKNHNICSYNTLQKDIIWVWPPPSSSLQWPPGISADPLLRGSAPRSLVCVCLVPDHTPAGVRVFRKRSFSTCCATFRHFFYLLFRMAWVRIWMLFECFGSASPRALEAGDSSFLVRSVGDVSAVFRAAVSHGLGTYSLGINPAAVPLFRKRFSKSFLFRMVWASILLAFLRVP